MGKKRSVVFILRGMPGLGHVSPGFAMAGRLAAMGFETHFITYANGATFLRKNSVQNVHGIDTPKHQKNIVPWKDLFEVTTEVLPILKEVDPGLIVVDGEFDAFFLLRRLEAKVIMLTTKPYVDYELIKYRAYADYVESAMKNVDAILVHGIERPIRKRKNQVFVGPLVRDFKNRTHESNVVPISIGFNGSTRLVKFAKRFGEVLRHNGYAPIMIGEEGAGAKFVKESLKYFSSAPFIVSHGGMATVEEAAVFGKPVAFLCDDDEEKDSNAVFAERQGYGIRLDVGKKPGWKELTYMIERLQRITGRMKPMHNGVDTAVEVAMRYFA